jgi:putative intracellular protease/amidase
LRKHSNFEILENRRADMKGRSVLAMVVAGFVAASAALAVGPRQAPQRNVAILIFPGVQIIDYTGPWEVFGHAYVDGRPAFHTYSVAEKAGPITTAMGMSVNPGFTFASAPRPDVLVVPGGNVNPQLDNPALMRWIGKSAGSARVVLSVCNGAFFLARVGLLDGLQATTFAGLIDELRTAAPRAKVVSDRRFVDNGRIVTAAGLSAGIDGSLHVIEKLLGKGAAQVAAVSLEYDWRPDSGYARASLADRRLSPAYGVLGHFRRSVVRYEGTRERWEASWRIQADAKPAEILREIDQAFAAEKGWGSRDTGSTAGGARSVWHFEDGDGGSWKGWTRVEAATDGAGGLLVTLEVARSMQGG